MAHIQQFNYIEKVKNLYPKNFADSKVLEVGSLDINGTVRKYFSDCEYLGIDIGPGPGVDTVIQGQDFRGPDNYFDTVLSCECFEHNPYWVETFVNMHRVCKAGGLVVMTCATTGRKEHGTSRSEPESSPLTVASGWDYYKNLEEKDFKLVLELDKMFSTYEFSNNLDVYDLYFMGVVK